MNKPSTYNDLIKKMIPITELSKHPKIESFSLSHFKISRHQLMDPPIESFDMSPIKYHQNLH